MENEVLERCYNEFMPSGRCTLPRGHKGFCVSPAEAENVRLRAAVLQAEAVMSIVKPRSDKAEYLQTLAKLRAALAAPSAARSTTTGPSNEDLSTATEGATDSALPSQEKP